MRYWLVTFLFSVLVSIAANASSDVESELCFIEIKAAISTGTQTGRYELSNKNCVKYKSEYDLKFGDPFRLKLKGEPNFPVAPKHYKNDADARDTCWDALAASDYNRETYFTNSGCQAFLEKGKTEHCFKLLDKMYFVDRNLFGGSIEYPRECSAYYDEYRRK